tara:strand:+ start:656 stop:880 length:225 start_codon:yes stop_codon:yes gene_type:complete
VSNCNQKIIYQLYRMVQSLRGGDDLPIVCGEHGPKKDGMPRYLKVSPSPGLTAYAIYELKQTTRESHEHSPIHR